MVKGASHTRVQPKLLQAGAPVHRRGSALQQILRDGFHAQRRREVPHLRAGAAVGVGPRHLASLRLRDSLLRSCFVVSKCHFVSMIKHGSRLGLPCLARENAGFK